MTLPKKIILAGFMGTGKTEVGRALAKKLQYAFQDTDEWVKGRTRKSIPNIFSEDGEKIFRNWESKAIEVALQTDRTVIAVGGGAVCSRENLRRLKKAGTLILLTARVPTILKRLSNYRDRPLLQGPDREGRIQTLLEDRAKFYEKISWKISTDDLTVNQITQHILRVLPLQAQALRVRLGKRGYPIYFQREGRKLLHDLLLKNCPASQVVLVTNTTLDKPYGRPLQKLLSAHLKVHKVVIPDGEKYKTLNTVQLLYQNWLRAKVDRNTPVIALGGGVIGDVVGFAAASFLRGIPYVQVPTTLLAQVDSSVGGKTGVDLAQGKNLVGAFYQPKFVLIDESFLQTLGRRQLICGMAEVIKYAAVFESILFRELENSMEALLSNGGRGMEAIIRRCCEWKGWVVERDEFETKGLRSLLNFGHTLGHAIETLTRYRKFTHGEAIAMGMAFAAERSMKVAGLPPPQARRMVGLLQKAGLPTALPAFSRSEYLQALARDKKRVSGDINFVYLKRIGRGVVKKTPMESLF